MFHPLHADLLQSLGLHREGDDPLFGNPGQLGREAGRRRDRHIRRLESPRGQIQCRRTLAHATQAHDHDVRLFERRAPQTIVVLHRKFHRLDPPLIRRIHAMQFREVVVRQLPHAVRHELEQRARGIEVRHMIPHTVRPHDLLAGRIRQAVNHNRLRAGDVLEHPLEFLRRVGQGMRQNVERNPRELRLRHRSQPKQQIPRRPGNQMDRIPLRQRTSQQCQLLRQPRPRSLDGLLRLHLTPLLAHPPVVPILAVRNKQPAEPCNRCLQPSFSCAHNSSAKSPRRVGGPGGTKNNSSPSAPPPTGSPTSSASPLSWVQVCRPERAVRAVPALQR